MNAISASHANAAPARPATHRILVWDVPVRVFHWLMVASFAGAYLTAESERWRLLHVTLGYTMAGLVGFRIFWGLVGSRYARFSSFLRGPQAVARYLKSLVHGKPEHHTGHNPAGALAILAMLLLTLAVTASGWAVYSDVAGKWLEEAHEVAANVMLTVIGVHIVAVLVSSWLHRENMVGSMISGRKPGRPEEAVGRAWTSVALLMLAAVVSFWWLQWQSAPVAGADQPVASARAGKQERHD